MNTKQLKYVLALAQEGSFSKAAEELGITQPSLSQYIKKIEKELGLSLFDRTKGDVRLTDAGQTYVETGRKILDLEHQMEVQLSDIAEDRKGSLIIGAAPYRAAGMLPVIAMVFQETHPGMHLIVREGTTVELVEGLEHGEYDLALTLLPVDRRLFSYESILEEELVLAVPGSFPAFPSAIRSDRKYPVVDVTVLNNQRLVLLTDAQFMQRRLEELVADYRLSLSTAAVVKSLQAQIAMVKAGVGIALMPAGIDRFCSGSEVVFYSFRQALPRREVALIWRRNRPLSRAAKDLKSIVLNIPW